MRVSGWTEAALDELVLQGVAMGGAEDAGAETLPILMEEAEGKRGVLEGSGADGSEAATTMTEEEEANAEGESEQREKPRAPGFVGRILREYALKRELNALVARKQAQLKHMQALVATYQETLVKAATEMEDDARQQRSDGDRVQKETRIRVAELLATGAERALVEKTRCIGLLEQQRSRILQERAVLRTTIVKTRQEECAWLLKSLVAQHESECEQLLSASTAKKFLEEGSLQATLAEQIDENDPIFAPVEQLFDAQPQTKQLQLQLNSIDAVLVTMKEKRDEMETQAAGASGPVPLVKRTSFRDRRPAEPLYPSSDQKRRVRLALLEGKRLREDRELDARHRHERYSAHQRTLGRLLGDVRTRTGSLLHHFVEKLHDDTLVQVKTSRSPGPIESNQTNIEQDTASRSSEGSSIDRYFISGMHHDSTFGHQRENSTETQLNLAVDVLKLPPPAMISAFTKFLERVITTEYDLLTVSPRSSSPGASSSGDDFAASTRDESLGQAILRDCIHDMVFSRIHVISAASAVDEYRFRREDNDDDDADSNCVASKPDAACQPWHWCHAKARIQQISPSELAFPDDVLESMVEYSERRAVEIRRNGFLPQTLSMLRTAERETTPKGVVRAVMTAFKVLHHEIADVLGGGNPSSLSQPPSLRGPRRRSSCFLNADVLIPTLVLIISRLPHPTYLNELWHRVMLVEAFRTTVLADGGEEAYYLTCLSAAMEFINSFDHRVLSQSESEEEPQHRVECLECRNIQEDLQARPITIEETKTAHDSPPTTLPHRTARGGTSHRPTAWSKMEHDSIKQLSKWISAQPPTDAIPLSDAERFVPVHELWCRSLINE